MNTIFIDGLSFALPLFIMAIGGIYSEKMCIRDRTGRALRNHRRRKTCFSDCPSCGYDRGKSDSDWTP